MQSTEVGRYDSRALTQQIGASPAQERKLGRIDVTLGELEQRNAHFAHLISRAHDIAQRLHSEPPPPQPGGTGAVAPVPSGLASRLECATTTYGTCLDVLGHLLDRIDGLT